MEREILNWVEKDEIWKYRVYLVKPSFEEYVGKIRFFGKKLGSCSVFTQ